MEKRPETIGELCFLIEGNFERLEDKLASMEENIGRMRHFVYWVAGIVGMATTSIFLAGCKILGII